MRPIVLASTSAYRRQLLARLHLPFDVVAPEVDETALAGESPRQTAQRLAQAKAQAVANRRPEAIVIGSDQVAELHGRPINKPGEHAAALAQLEQMQGQTVDFHTGLAVFDAGRVQSDCVSTRVRFRQLSREQLDRYLTIDRAYDCAGAAKIESLGIALVEAVHSDDPTALIGLPLIRLTSMLRDCGVLVPAA